MILWKFIRYRFYEVIVWLGTPVVGVFLADERIVLIPFVTFLVATVLLILHTLLLNDWAGLTINPSEINRIGGVSNFGTAGAKALGYGSVLILMVSVSLFATLESRLLIPIAFWVGLSILYSHPATHWKGHAVGSLMLHVLGGIVKFVLGYLLFSNDFVVGITLGIFFSLLFSAGSLIHQCLHESEDKYTELQTTAVRFGAQQTFVWAICLFLCSHLYLIVLSWVQIVSWPVTGIFSLAIIVHLYAIRLKMSKQGDSVVMINRYQQMYRLLYGGLCLIIILLTMLKKLSSGYFIPGN